MKTRARGFTLVELMVASTLGLLILAAVGQIYLVSKHNYTTQQTLSHIQDTGRYAMDTISAELRMAGYFGGNGDVSLITGDPGPATANGSCATATGDNTWGRQITQRIFGLNDTNAGYACISNADYVAGDILTVRYAKPVPLDSATGANTLYLRAAPYEGRLLTGGTSGLTANTVADPQPALYALAAFAYYVSPKSASGNATTVCQGVRIPALARKLLNSSGRPEREELAIGVENLQFEYGIDTDNDRAVNQYVSANAVPDWRAVVAVRVWILVRDECPETGYTNNQRYVMGDRIITPNDGFRRQLFSTTIQLRN